jgi:hypothetical protein
MQLTVRPSESDLSFIVSCSSPHQAIQGHVANLVQGHKIQTEQNNEVL